MSAAEPFPTLLGAEPLGLEVGGTVGMWVAAAGFFSAEAPDHKEGCACVVFFPIFTLFFCLRRLSYAFTAYEYITAERGCFLHVAREAGRVGGPCFLGCLISSMGAGAHPAR